MKQRNAIVSTGATVLIVAGLYIVLGFMLLPEGDLAKKQQSRWEKTVGNASGPNAATQPPGETTGRAGFADYFQSTPEMLAKGRHLFEDNCVVCHGTAGKGDGPASVALEPKPRDFTSPDGWTNGYTIGGIFQTVSDGVKGTGMVPFTQLSVEERFALAQYVRSLGQFDHGTDTPQEITALAERYGLPGKRPPDAGPDDGGAPE